MSPYKGFTYAIPDEEVRDLLEGLIAFAPIAIMITDAEGNVIGVNQAHTQLTGLTFERIVFELRMNFRHYLRVVNPQAADELERAYRGETVELTDFFYRVKPPPGVEPLTEKLAKGFWINSRVFPIKDAEGNVKYVVIMNEDITAKKELELMLAQAQKMETIGRLAGGLAHDFNNILSGIVGYASLILARLPPNSEDYEAARIILEAADRATVLTNQLLTIARKSVPVLQPMLFQEVMPRIVAFLSRTIGPAHTIRLSVDPDTFEVEADRPQMEQVIANLCVNARDAMPQGGEIVITVGNAVFEQGKCPLPTMPAGEYVQISVKDHGVGMPPDVLSHIFEPFFTTKESGRGTGLGLAIVYGIVKSHRGFIKAISSVGEGSEFIIYLPRFQGKRVLVEDKKVHTRESEAPTGLEVLVVDDDPMVRQVMCDMLYRLGHKAVGVDGARSALEILMKDWSRFDVLVVDVLMPERDGFALVEAVRAAGSQVPIVLCTGYSAPEMYEHAKRFSGVLLLPKPFDVHVFGDVIISAVSKGK